MEESTGIWLVVDSGSWSWQRLYRGPGVYIIDAVTAEAARGECLPWLRVVESETRPPIPSADQPSGTLTSADFGLGKVAAAPAPPPTPLLPEVEPNAEGRLPCPSCTRDYASPASLARHVERSHPSPVE